MQVQLTPGMHAREGISILQSDVKAQDAILAFSFTIMMLNLMLPTRPDPSTRSSCPVS